MKERHRAVFNLLLAWIVLIALLAIQIVVWTRFEMPLWAKMLILFLIMIVSPNWEDLTRLHHNKATEVIGLPCANNEQDATAPCDDRKRDEGQ
jgi:hypothetical protein